MTRLPTLVVPVLAAVLLAAAAARSQITVFPPALEAGDDFVTTQGSSTFFDPLANDAVYGLGQLDPYSFEILDVPAYGSIELWDVSESHLEVLYLRDVADLTDSVRYRVCTRNGECDEAVMWLLWGTIGPLVSAQPDRSDPVQLSAATLSGEVYIFVPDLFTPGDVSSVRFLWNGEPMGYETQPPWDLAGGTATLANPLTTTELPDGTATVTTEIRFGASAGGHLARFDTDVSVSNQPLLAFSYSSDRSSAGALDGGFFGGEVYVFLGTPSLHSALGPVPLGGTGIRRVRFTLDGDSVRSERVAPYDLGGGGIETAYPFDMSALAEGPHSLVATIFFSDGSQQIVRAEFRSIQ